MNESLFTAAEIAQGLGQTRQAVQRTLSCLPAKGSRLVRGNQAVVWSVAQLPAKMREQLALNRKRKGYRSIEHLLSDPPRRYESPVPLQNLSPKVIAQAQALCRAFAQPLRRMMKGSDEASLTSFGLAEYERVLGQAIEARHWRRLLQRILDRDAGYEQWDRLDLYIDERCAPMQWPLPSGKKNLILELEKNLQQHVATVADVLQPTEAEKALLWVRAFAEMNSLVERGEKLNHARKLVRQTLWKCGVALAGNFTSFQRLWLMKEKVWHLRDGHISAVRDARSKNSGYHRAPEIPQSDLDTLVARAVRLGGRISQAWREVLEEKLLSPEIQNYYQGLYPASKSYVPGRIRAAMTHEVRLMEDIHHGPRRAQLNGAYAQRDWTTVPAGDWYQADDVTFNNYYYAPADDGGFTFMRGQVLLMIDVRSTCILSFAMLDQRNYTSHTIRTLITRTCDQHGMPRKGFYFERGIWESSRLLKGTQSDATFLTEQEVGLREFFEFKHSRMPKSKPVERVIGQMQNLLEGQPGDAGRSEMADGFERMNQNKRRVESGQERPEKYFLSALEWEEVIAQKCEEYNHARNDGKMTLGLTPWQAWQQYQDTPLVHLTGDVRYLLAHHKKTVKVGRNGIVLRFGKNSYVYRNEVTGRLIGQHVIAWFNPELPELLAVTDMNKENPFTVERAEALPAMEATDEMLHEALAKIEAHQGYAKNRYRMLAAKINITPRSLYVDRATVDLGRAFSEQKEEMLDKKAKRQRRMTEAKQVFRGLDMSLQPEEEITDRRMKAAKRLTQKLKGTLHE